jgi:predicted transcriptional regulator
MLRFLKNRMASAGQTSAFGLGHLELQVMEILWQRACNVHDVIARLDRALAYTTVMTTLDRLYKKGLLDRRKSERAFVYSARLSREAWERRQTGEFMDAFLGRANRSGDLLISCLVEAVSERDRALLDELEKKIKSKRKELNRREKA